MNGTSPDTWSDEELLAVAVAEASTSSGRQAASSLLRRYHVRVYQWCAAQLGDPDLGQDIAQEVLLKAYHKLESFGGRSCFSSWLFAIARNRCLDELRRPRLTVSDVTVAEMVDTKATPAAEFEARATEAEWQELLACHLEPVEQEVMILRYFESVPIDEITRMLDIRQASGARGLLQKSRRKLRAALNGEEWSTHE